jgi:hypothetical protein
VRTNRDGVVTEEGAPNLCEAALARKTLKGDLVSSSGTVADSREPKTHLGFTSRDPMATLRDTAVDVRRRGVA